MKNSIQIDTLKLMLPQYSERFEGFFGKQLVGDNRIRIYAKGREPMELSISIDAVELMEEADTAVPYLQSQNLLKEDPYLTAVFDIGGLTAISFVVDSNGTIYRESRRVEPKGTKDLFAAILSDETFKSGMEPLGLTFPSPTSLQNQIIEASKHPKLQLTFSNEPNGTFDWTDIFRHHGTEWLNGIRNKSYSEWRSIPGIAEYLKQLVVIGGGASIAGHFIAEKNRNIHLIAPNAQYASVLGALQEAGDNTAVVDTGNRFIKSAFAGDESVAILDSHFAYLREVPRLNAHIPADTLIIQYLSGPCLNPSEKGWIKAFGQGAKALSRNSQETHNTSGKEHFSHFLALAGLANATLVKPVTVAGAKKAA